MAETRAHRRLDWNDATWTCMSNAETRRFRKDCGFTPVLDGDMLNMIKELSAGTDRLAVNSNILFTSKCVFHGNSAFT